ncbi:hypothetical protein [Phenylobacterium kunshanense]|uniref:Helix-turn-helix domain-containing protein n=1 Tax=Phenylobacterium kunshanense TaxID=1445034 RepID=A0A328BQT2_9CAUL|nr:hypothetical protein [Phenylobacterium kunshanense]RAK68871.1 hypothetical protein DJ019_02325 [Phenylobacterium kunshanense]
MSEVTSKRRSGAGYSIPAAAAEVGASYKTFLAAVDRGHVRVVEFGGLRRVPAAEVARLKALFSGAGEAA